MKLKNLSFLFLKQNFDPPLAVVYLSHPTKKTRT